MVLNLSRHMVYLKWHQLALGVCVQCDTWLLTEDPVTAAVTYPLPVRVLQALLRAARHIRWQQHVTAACRRLECSEQQEA